MRQLYYAVGDETGQRIKSFEEIKEEVYYRSNFLTVHKWEYLGKTNEEKMLYCEAVFRIRKDFLSIGLSQIDRVCMAKVQGYVENDRYIKSNLWFLMSFFGQFNLERTHPLMHALHKAQELNFSREIILRKLPYIGENVNVEDSFRLQEPWLLVATRSIKEGWKIVEGYRNDELFEEILWEKIQK